MCFCTTPVTVFGLRSVSGRHHSLPRQCKVVRQYPIPKNVKDVRYYLRLVSFHKRLIPKFAEISKPLTKLTTKDVQFRWKGRQQATFEILKETLCSDQFLAYPDSNSQFIYDNRRFKDSSSSNIVPGAKWGRKPHCFCEPADE